MKTTIQQFATRMRNLKNERMSYLRLNRNDFLKGAIIAILTAVLATLGKLLESGTLFDKKSLVIIGTAALSAFVAYLSTIFVTNSQNQLLKKEK